MTDEQTYFGDPQGTRSRAKDMASAGERLKSAINRHMGTITGLEAGEPWGTDEPGRKFANGENNDGYHVSSQGYFEAVAGSGTSPGVGDAVKGLGDAVVATVDYVQAMDDGNAGDVRKAGEV